MPHYFAMNDYDIYGLLERVAPMDDQIWTVSYGLISCVYIIGLLYLYSSIMLTSMHILLRGDLMGTKVGPDYECVFCT